MRFWTTDWSYNDFFNRLRFSRKFAGTEFSEVHVRLGKLASLHSSSKALSAPRKERSDAHRSEARGARPHSTRADAGALRSAVTLLLGARARQPGLHLRSYTLE